MRRFVVIDPSEAARERFRQLLGPELRVRFEPHEWRFGEPAGSVDSDVAHWIAHQPW